ncbi:MAG TPA: histidine kinase dimerization/phospho-acceptor domain-containing protein, partial [Chthoniobacterales bacterium]
MLLFTPAAALLLCCALGVLYWIVLRHAFEEDNAFLADKISALRADLTKGGGPEAVREELKALRAGERTSYWVRVLDSSGRTLAQTPGMDRLLPPEIFPRARIAAASDRGPQDYRASNRLFSLVATNENSDGKSYTIQVAQDRSEDEHFMKEFGALLAIVLALGVLASGLIAITVAKRGLRPLGDMTRSLKRIGPNRLHERIPVAGWPKELQPLALAFDDLLDRLEDSFKRLSQFSADLAHELRTPVANIRGEAEVALTRTRTIEEYRAVLESTVAECENLSGIVDNLLFLARAEAAESQTHQTVFDGRAAIEKIAAFYEPVAEEQHVTVRCAGEAAIHADQMLF